MFEMMIVYWAIFMIGLIIGAIGAAVMITTAPVTYEEND